MMKGSLLPCAKIFVANSVFTNSQISSKGILLIAGQVGVNAITNLSCFFINRNGQILQSNGFSSFDKIQPFCPVFFQAFPREPTFARPAYFLLLRFPEKSFRMERIGAELRRNLHKRENFTYETME